MSTIVVHPFFIHTISESQLYMDKFAVIVAGGSGSRMKSSIPKQFLQLCGKPILMHTLLVFYEYDPNIKIFLVLSRADEAYWKELVDQHEFTVPHKIIHGGASRFQSVKNVGGRND